MLLFSVFLLRCSDSSWLIHYWTHSLILLPYNIASTGSFEVLFYLKVPSAFHLPPNCFLHFRTVQIPMRENLRDPSSTAGRPLPNRGPPPQIGLPCVFIYLWWEPLGLLGLVLFFAQQFSFWRTDLEPTSGMLGIQHQQSNALALNGLAFHLLYLQLWVWQTVWPVQFGDNGPWLTTELLPQSPSHHLLWCSAFMSFPGYPATSGNWGCALPNVLWSPRWPNRWPQQLGGEWWEGDLVGTTQRPCGSAAVSSWVPATNNEIASNCAIICQQILKLISSFLFLPSLLSKLNCLKGLHALSKVSRAFQEPRRSDATRIGQSA